MKKYYATSASLILVLSGCSSGAPSHSSQDTSNAAQQFPPAAEIDGVIYSGDEQIQAMTQAAKDSGMDDATAKRVGEEAALLCNGNPDCLR